MVSIYINFADLESKTFMCSSFVSPRNEKHLENSELSVRNLVPRVSLSPPPRAREDRLSSLALGGGERETLGTRLVRTRGPDGKIRTAGARGISQSDSRI